MIFTLISGRGGSATLRTGRSHGIRFVAARSAYLSTPHEPLPLRYRNLDP